MRDVTAIVFDLDGTLIDSAEDLRAVLATTLHEEGLRPLAIEEVKRIVGDGAAVLVRRALAIAGGPDGAEQHARVTERFLQIYQAWGTRCTRAYAHVPETLQSLVGRGIALGICTNKPEQPTRTVLRDLDLDRYFSAVLGGDSLGGIRKPDPRHLAATLEALGVLPDRALMVGDSANDVAAARGLGIPVIVRAAGYGAVPSEQLGADAIIGTFSELPAAIATVSAGARVP